MNERYKTTILLTTHDITDIEALCERVIMPMKEILCMTVL